MLLVVGYCLFFVCQKQQTITKNNQQGAAIPLPDTKNQQGAAIPLPDTKNQ